jgi:SPASM domain peptide maturase of grasp-with-spasm system
MVEAPARKAFFRLYACCIPVRGARRSIICDLQRNTYVFIPNILFEILTEQAGRPVDEIRASYGPDGARVIDSYFAFLEEKDLGFWWDDPARFPPLDLTWARPERITNAIIDVDERSRHPYERIFAELDELGCKTLQLRFYCASPSAELGRVLDFTRRGRLRTIEVLVRHGPDLTHEVIVALCREHARLRSVVVHGAPRGAFTALPELGVSITYTTALIDSPSCCGEVHPAYFVANLPVFSEAQRYNTCLNRKISIDAAGEIRNCPSLPVSYGNIRDTSLHSALMHRDFRELWEINKDRIDTCRVCEFRYICTDCRAFISDPSDRFSKPSKCTYDPYTASWGE